MNQNNKNIPIRIDDEFARIIREDIPLERIRNNVDTKLRSPREVTKKMMKHPLFPKLVEDLETFKFKDE